MLHLVIESIRHNKNEIATLLQRNILHMLINLIF